MMRSSVPFKKLIVAEVLKKSSAFKEAEVS
jgi:hypothetical protein